MFQLFLSKFKLKHFLGGLALLVSLVWLAVLSFPDQKLHLIFCNVGQGDAILIEKGFNQILIDGGPDKKVLDCLSNNLPFWDRTIEAVALTHPQADHLSGLEYVIDRYSVRYFLAGMEGNESSGYTKFLEKIKQKPKIKVINPFTGEKFNIGGIELTSVWPQKEWVAQHIEAGSGKLEAGNISPLTSESSLALPSSHFVLGASTTTDLNNFSLVFLLNYGGKKVLLPGDADAGIQDEILLSNATLNKIDILKVPHHGAKTSLRDDFLEKIMPKVAVISVGKNSYGHPSGELIKKMEDLGIQVRRTDLEGEIKFEF